MEEVFLDGLTAGSLSGVSTITVSSPPVILGNSYSGGSPLKSNLRAVLIINRKLTATEHIQLYSELESLVYPTQTSSANAYPDTEPAGVWKSDWGCEVSIS